MDFILEWWKAFLTVGIAIVGASALAWLRSTFVTKKVHEVLESRLSAVEKTVEDLPNADDLHDLDKRLIEVSGKIDGLNPQLTDLKRLTDLLMENELRGTRSNDS
jgi:GTP1/Obg family GTP-binding protein